MNETSLGKRIWHAFLRLFIAQILCVVLFATLGTESENTIYLTILSAVLAIVFFAVDYCTAWYFGIVDRGRAAMNEIKKKPLLGAAISALAILPFTAVDLIISALYMAGNEFFSGAFVLLNTQFYFITMSRDFEQQPAQLLLITLAMTVIAAAVGTIGYILGLNDISLVVRLLYKKEKEDK